jgi:putative FmdB family regulatory protein
MPLYEFVCQDCRRRFEALVRRFGDAVSCPACAGGRVEKQLSTFALASGGGASVSVGERPRPATGGCCGGGCGCAH